MISLKIYSQRIMAEVIFTAYSNIVFSVVIFDDAIFDETIKTAVTDPNS